MKTQIIEELGQGSILLPALVAEGLAANDRIKVRMSALQAAAQHAQEPDRPANDLAVESQTAGIAPAGIAALNGLPYLSYAADIEPDTAARTVRVKRITPTGYDVLEAGLPALISGTQALGEVARRSAGGLTLDNLEPVWPWEHAAVDPFRFYGWCGVTPENQRRTRCSGGNKLASRGEKYALPPTRSYRLERDRDSLTLRDRELLDHDGWPAIGAANGFAQGLCGEPGPIERGHGVGPRGGARGWFAALLLHRHWGESRLQSTCLQGVDRMILLGRITALLLTRAAALLVPWPHRWRRRRPAGSPPSTCRRRSRPRRRASGSS